MKKILSAVLSAAMLFSGAALISTGSVSANTRDALVAEYEDSTVQLWFEHAREKVVDTDTEPSGMKDYTVYMAKNEIEDAQFVLAAESDMEGLTASCTDFTDEAGNVIPSRIFKEYYIYAGVDGQKTPDAIPPLDDGEFSLAANKAQAFLIKLTTTPDTPAGDYHSVLSVYNAAGEEIKRAAVSVHVWDFVIPEDPGIDTAIYLDTNMIARYYKNNDSTYMMYYNYLLENRICAFNIPYNPATAKGIEFLKNDRITAFRVGDFSYNGGYVDSMLKRVNAKLSEDKTLFDKHWFYVFDEPSRPEQFDGIITECAHIKEVFPGARVTVPLHTNSAYVVNDTEKKDAIEVLMENLNLWCPMTYAYVDQYDMDAYAAAGGKLALRNLNPSNNVGGVDWDMLYGTFEERLDARKLQTGEDIKEWFYVCATMGGTSGANLLIDDDGVDPEMIFWQAKQNDVEGFLYYYANFWVTGDAINDVFIPVGGLGLYLYGDGVVMYPGPCFGIEEPVGSLRIEGMRDGIEIYAMLSMYEDAVGYDEMQKIISKVSTNILLFTEDKDLLIATKRELGDKLEKALHGEIDPPAPQIVKGDANGDGSVDMNDILIIKRAIAGLSSLPDERRSAVDVNGDGKVNAGDILLIKRHIAGLLDFD